jgi:hypothetical protein
VGVYVCVRRANKKETKMRGKGKGREGEDGKRMTGNW